MAKRKKITQKEIIFTVITWAFLLWLINFLCGLVVQNRYIAVDPIDAKTAETSYGYFRPNQDKVILFPGLEPYKVKINQLGLRTVGGDLDMGFPEVMQRKTRILALGDSLTFGLFVDDENTFPWRLQQMINENGKDAIVLNAGIGGGTVTDYLYYLKVRGLQFKPQVVTLNFCTNDFGEMNREKPLYQMQIEEGVFDLFETVKLAKFMRVFRKFELEHRYQRWLKKTKDDEVREALKNKSQDIDDILKVAVYHAGTPVTDPYSEELTEYWQRYFQTLDDVNALVKENGAKLLFIIYPDFATVYNYGKANYQEILLKHLKQKDIDYVDLRPVFQQNKAEILEIYNDLPRDFHLSGYGNSILAEEVYKHIKGEF